MKEYTRVALTKDRLKEAMQAAGKKQADLVRETGLNRGTISRYYSGEVEPRQDATYKLAAVLGVNEMWLWGYDVPMARTPSAIKNDQLAELVVKMRRDPEFFEAVVELSKLNAEEFKRIKDVISILHK
jgi:transcriptional regulator with XRE-family HTH domain